MYVSTTRFTINGSGLEEHNGVFTKARELLSAQPGFHSMSLYNIDEGEHKGDRFVVIRFADKATFNTAIEATRAERDVMVATLKPLGIERVDQQRLEEVVL